MKTYKFTNGDIITSNLNSKELMKRMRRLDVLRVLTENYETGVGTNICKKALAAYNKMDNFTGIIRLTKTEKEFIGYMLENEFNNEEDIEVLKFYLR